MALTWPNLPDPSYWLMCYFIEWGGQLLRFLIYSWLVSYWCYWDCSWKKIGLNRCDDYLYLYFVLFCLQSKYIAECIDEIKQELRQDNQAIKANAVSKLTYVSLNVFHHMNIEWNAAYSILEWNMESDSNFLCCRKISENSRICYFHWKKRNMQKTLLLQA